MSAATRLAMWGRLLGTGLGNGCIKFCSGFRLSIQFSLLKPLGFGLITKYPRKILKAFKTQK
jgi:hypothetical protein